MHVFLWGTGEQEYCEYLKSLAESLELSDCVMFRGYTSNMDDALLECDVVVVPSRAESFSLVTVEAMMAGIPVVVSRCGGPEEIVDDRIDGRIVSVGDHENLAEVLDELFANPDVAYEIAQKAVEKVKNHFSLDKKLEEIINVIFNASEMKSRKIY
jgi:glycosyltransferase involved in cell wall biosynthesis